MISACKGTRRVIHNMKRKFTDRYYRWEPYASRRRHRRLVSIYVFSDFIAMLILPFRIGTFIGHKGAVWQARLSPDASNAATASADFTAYVSNYFVLLKPFLMKI